MKNLFIVIQILISLNVVGQDHLIGIKVGVNQTNISSSKFLSNTKYRTGISAGLSYEYWFKKHFLLGADLIYNQRGFVDDFIFTDDQGNPTGEKARSKFNYDYLSLPIKTGVSIGNKFSGFVNIGLLPSILVDARTHTPMFNADKEIDGIITFNFTSRVTRFDLAGLLEIGLDYKIKDRYCLFTLLGYQHSFTTITNSEYFARSEIKHRTITLVVGLKRRLIRK